MFGLLPATRIYLAVGATDLRKGFEGLYGLVRDRLLCEPTSGHHQEKQIGQACNDLNQVYQKILAILQNQINAGDDGAKEKDYLVAAERRWIQWRDAEALSEAYASVVPPV